MTLSVLHALLYTGLISAVLILCRKEKNRRLQYLACVIVLLFASNAVDGLLQTMGSQYVQWFVWFALPFLFVGPLFVSYASQLNGEGQYQFWLYLVPLPLIITLMVFWFSLPAQQKLVLLTSPEAARGSLAVSLLFDVFTLICLFVAVKKLKEFGISINNWFSAFDGSQVDDIRKTLLFYFCAILAHIPVTIAGYLYQLPLNAINLLLQLIFIIAFCFMHVNLSDSVLEFALERCSQHTGQSDKVAQRASCSVYPDERLLETLKKLQRVEQEALFLDANLTIGRLARKLSVPAKLLSVAINDKKQQSFFSYINALRIDYAKQQLACEPDMPVSEIADTCGFNSRSAFYNAFNRYAGVTPGEFRRSAQ